MNVFSRLISASAIAVFFSGVAALPAGASDWAPASAVESPERASPAAHGELLRFLLEPVADPGAFHGRRIAIVASENTSAFELEVTRDYFMDRGARVHILAPRPIERAPLVGLAGAVPPRELIALLDYAGARRLVAVTWYLDQVNPGAYDAIFIPNNLRDIESLASNSQAIRFLLTAQGTQRPIFVSGNARGVVPGVQIPARPIGVALSNPATSVQAAEDAFDLPRLIGALAATLAATPERDVN